MKSYVDFYTYMIEYCGTAVPEKDFNGLAIKASAYLDSITYGNITELWHNDSRVINACCAVIEELYRQLDGKGEISSESNHSVSRSYAVSGKSNEQKLYEAARIYLANTGLLYGGM